MSAKVIVDRIEKGRNSDMSRHWEILSKQAEISYQQGELVDAEAFWLAALEETRHMDADDLRPASTLDRLGDVMSRQSKLVIAELFYKQAVHIRTQILGSDHLSVAASLNNLARFYYLNGRYGQAEPITLAFVKIYEQTLGENHTDVSIAYHNLATLYFVQKNYRKAERAYRKALAIRQVSLGAEHPDTLKLVRNLQTLTEALRQDAEDPSHEQVYKQQGSVGLISGSWKALPSLEQGTLLTDDEQLNQ